MENKFLAHSSTKLFSARALTIISLQLGAGLTSTADISVSIGTVLACYIPQKNVCISLWKGNHYEMENVFIAPINQHCFLAGSFLWMQKSWLKNEQPRSEITLCSERENLRNGAYLPKSKTSCTEYSGVFSIRGFNG